MLAPALRRHAGDRSFQDLQQALLDAFAGHVARDGHVFHPPRDLVDLVDVDDAQLRARHVAVRRADQAQQDVFHVLADVAGLGDGRRVGNAEGHVEDARERPRQQRLAAARRAQHQDVALVDLDAVVVLLPHQARLDALVVVVNGDGEDLLHALLADDELVEPGLDLVRLGHLQARRRRRLGRAGLGVRTPDHRVADVHALVADVQVAGPGDEGLDRGPRPPAERAGRFRRQVFLAGHGPYAFAGAAPSTSSTRPYATASWADMKKSRSVSLATSLTDLPVCLARMPLR